MSAHAGSSADAAAAAAATHPFKHQLTTKLFGKSCKGPSNICSSCKKALYSRSERGVKSDLAVSSLITQNATKCHKMHGGTVPESDPKWTDAVRLCAHNADVDAYNSQRLNALAAGGGTVHKLVAGHGMVKQGHVTRCGVNKRLIPPHTDNCGGLRDVLEVMQACWICTICTNRTHKLYLHNTFCNKGNPVVHMLNATSCGCSWVGQVKGQLT